MKSIRGTLSRHLLLGTSLLLLVTFFFQEHRFRLQLETDFDLSMLAKAKALVTLTRQHNGAVELDFDDEVMPEYDAPVQPEYFQLWLASGELLERSRSLAGEDLPHKRDLAPEEPKFTDIELPDGRKGRMAQLKFVPHTKDSNKAERNEEEINNGLEKQSATSLQAHLSVARERETLDDSLASARLTLGITSSLFLAALFILVRIAIARGLAPLSAMARQVRALNADSLTARIDTDHALEELEPVVTQLNELLSRLETSFDREKRFSGNVAHELRTPLAELRSIAEIGSKWPDDAKLVKEFYADLLDATEGMEHTVANLLALARCDAGQVDVFLEPVSLVELVEDVWLQSATNAAQRSLRIDENLTDVIVRTDRNKAKILVQNLIANAVEYSPEDAEILVRGKFDDDTIGIAFTNQSPQLDEQDLDKLFDRFWRKDAARTGGHHAGLGLSLVKALADVLQLKLIPVLENKVFTIRVSGFVRTSAAATESFAGL